ncbi:MAG: amino acid permease [Chlorobiaceae bacterium]|nr:amino acid permease [Chlorobiaceae bacterium]MBA4308706.1 amino acid permease [Chlorobiaceae bacterium]
MIKTKSSKELVRGLSLIAAIMIVSGSMIGSGIFRKPASMAEQLMSPELIILVWIVAGIATLIGALSIAELSGMFSSTGGQYIYFKESYGDFTAYAYGWSVIAVVQTGSQAAIAFVFAEYVGFFFKLPDAPKFLQDIVVYMPFVGNINPFADFGTKAVAISCIFFLTFVNYIGVVFGGFVQSLITFIKIFTILLLTVLIFMFGSGSASNIYTGFAVPPEVSSNIFVLFGLALAGAFWAYDGWINVTYVSGEVKNPQHNVPKALFLGTLIVIGVYVLINLAYLYVIPVEEMQHSELVAATAAEKIFGFAGASIISIAVIISAFGALNGSILSTARVPYAMGRSGLFFKSLGKVHPKYATPHLSLLLLSFWSSMLVMSGSFDTISNYVVFAAWLFYMLGAYGVVILRKKMPDAHRPYKTWGYPYTTYGFIIFSLLFLMNTLISDTKNAMMGIYLILLGLPIYFYHKYLHDKIFNKKDKL